MSQAFPRDEKINFFTGPEIERTPMYEHQTLFCVGPQSMKDIEDNLANHPEINHVFLCRFFDHAFNMIPLDIPSTVFQVKHLLGQGRNVTLEIPADYVTDELVNALPEHDEYMQYGAIQGSFGDTASEDEYIGNFSGRFCLLVGVYFPSKKKLQDMMTLKLHSKMLSPENGGVWCQSARSFVNHSTKTRWREYAVDRRIS